MHSSLPPDTSSQLSPQPVFSPGRVRFAGLRGVSFWMVAGVLFGIVVLVAILLEVTSPPAQALIGKLGRLLSMALAAFCCIWVSRRSAPGRERWAWNCVALAVIGYVVAQAFIVLLAFTNQPTPDPGMTAALFGPFYVLGATGILCFPAVQTTGMKLVYLLLDIFIVVGALLGLGFVLALVPRLAEGLPVDYGLMVIPLVDVTALLAFVVLLAQGVQRSYRPTILWLILTALCFAYGDFGLSYLSLPPLPGAPSVLPLYDAIWLVGAFAVSLAALSVLLPDAGSGAVWDRLEALISRLSLPKRYRWLVQLIGVVTPAMVLFGLMVYTELLPGEHTTLPLLILGAVVVVFILARQLLTARDLVDARIATERAEQLDELKDQFITSVNHELRTPLMTMKGYLTLLTDAKVQAPQEKRREMLARADRSCENLVYLVQGILDTRRIDQEASNFTPEPVNLQEAMRAALTLIDPREADPSSRQIAVAIPDHLAVWGEALRVQQILTNLLSNAIKYSPEGTPIVVQARAHDAPARTFPLIGGKSSTSPMVEITVQDWGLGIPPEQKGLLFRRFVRLPRDIASTTRGTGLGLYLCRAFAEAMGGSIWVESSGVPGEGSTFHLRLPTPPTYTATAPSLEAVGTNS